MIAYKLHEILIAPARETAGFARLAGGVVLIVVAFVILNGFYFETIRSLPQWPEINGELVTGTSARAIWLLLFLFAPLLMALGIVMQLLHKRFVLSLAGPRPLVIRDFRRVLWFLLPLFIVMAMIPTPDAFSTIPNMAFARWVTLAPVSLGLILLQTSTEELLFRGYLQSHLAARFSSPLVWMVLPSLLFGALHFDPQTFGSNALPLAAWSVLFGLAAADLTARAGNLGPALAMHFINNVSAMMFSAMDGHWDGIALFVVPFGPADIEAIQLLLPTEAIFLLCSWLVARIAIQR